MTASYVEPCREVLQDLVEQGLVDAAILCTVDGLPITHAADMDLPADATSAMSASMLALGDAMVGSVGEDEKSQQVVMESPSRTIGLIHAGENMALAVVGRAGMNLGMVLSHAKIAADKIVDIVTKSADHAEVEKHKALKRASLEELVQRVLQEAAENRKSKE
ncbi:MAG: roadblock/LC7 domain-containing protein [Calditrichaeota bacterium]|nr:MAG: roadblock/LC7 domain-containing protein [Calditrichota bacterium]